MKQRCLRCGYPDFSEEGVCPFCQRIDPFFQRFFSLFIFEGIHKELLHLYKSGEMKNLRYLYADAIDQYLRKRQAGNEKPVLVPVPPRKGKVRKEGWDQVDLLCQTLRKSYGYTYVKALKRSDRIQQKTLGRKERVLHLESSIGTRKKMISRLSDTARVILLDDVFTTGATLKSCGSALKKESGVFVEGLVLCAVL